MGIDENEEEVLTCFTSKSPMGSPMLQGELDKALYDDDKEEFVSIIEREAKFSGTLGIFQAISFRSRKQELLAAVCRYSSVKCAAALINGETSLIVDVNLPCGSNGLLPLHHAANFCSPSIIELYLYHGARTDLRCTSDEPIYYQKLPLNLALQTLSYDVRTLWTPEQSIFKLLLLLCLPRGQNTMESVGLLAWKTKETEEEFFHYAREGKLMELTALLTVAREKLIDPIMKIRNSLSFLRSYVLIDEDKRAAMLRVLQLLDVFERAGDAIEAYVKQEKIDVTRDQSIQEVACLLRQAGIALKHSDTDFSDCQWFQDENFISKLVGKQRECREKPKDADMPHYSKSGYRWAGCSEVGKIQGLSNATVEKIPKPGPFVPHEPWNSTVLPRRILNFFNVKASRATSSFHFHTGVETDAKNKVKGAGLNLSNVSSIKPWASLASVIKRVIKRI